MQLLADHGPRLDALRGRRHGNRTLLETICQSLGAAHQGAAQHDRRGDDQQQAKYYDDGSCRIAVPPQIAPQPEVAGIRGNRDDDAPGQGNHEWLDDGETPGGEQDQQPDPDSRFESVFQNCFFVGHVGIFPGQPSTGKMVWLEALPIQLVVNVWPATPLRGLISAYQAFGKTSILPSRP